MNYFHNETEIVMFGLFACDNDKDENEKQEEKDMDEGALDWPSVPRTQRPRCT